MGRFRKEREEGLDPDAAPTRHTLKISVCTGRVCLTGVAAQLAVLSLPPDSSEMVRGTGTCLGPSVGGSTPGAAVGLLKI